MGDQIFPAVVGNSKKGAKQMAAEVALKILSGESAPRVLPEQVQRASLEHQSALGWVPPLLYFIFRWILPQKAHFLRSTSAPARRKAPRRPARVRLRSVERPSRRTQGGESQGRRRAHQIPERQPYQRAAGVRPLQRLRRRVQTHRPVGTPP